MKFLSVSVFLVFDRIRDLVATKSASQPSLFILGCGMIPKMHNEGKRCFHIETNRSMANTIKLVLNGTYS